MNPPDSTLRATICVALKSASKDVRRAFQDKNWQIREQAGHDLTAAVMKALEAFEITMKPARTPPARSLDPVARKHVADGSN